MSQPNPWGENWHNENYSAAEMDELLDRVFGSKCISLGFQPAGKRKWVKARPDGTMEVIYVHSDRGFKYYPSFGLSFPWIPHGDWKKVCWHRTPKSAVIDLGYEPPKPQDSFAWAISKEKTSAAERAESVSIQVLNACKPWFLKTTGDKKILEILARRRNSPHFYNFVQGLTVDLFWQARSSSWQGFDVRSGKALKAYFGEEGLPEVNQLLEDLSAKHR